MDQTGGVLVYGLDFKHRITRTLNKEEQVKVSGVLTLFNPVDCSLAGSSVHGILQARILEWVAIPDPGIKPRSPALQADSLLSEPPGKPIPVIIFGALGT